MTVSKRKIASLLARICMAALFVGSIFVGGCHYDHDHDHDHDHFDHHDDHPY